ncbi:N-terminal acetyltransferase A complex subunit nat1 [Cladophialophora carrionii]|uniref:N-terminal acetyltransferase A complex subunit nat1 n=1 Tax=Cladophialophora carrionii TaxID=86049 RepID=A0A1C1CUW4_9EURO|nr:N-terminal acetyltransferase A complex subunit nat1 [Cladophialophora carrionii]
MAQAQPQLSNKDGALFRQVVRHFENKQYKKGLKAAEQILRKTPNHADTQAMKALIISHQGHTEEAFALAKTALNNNMKSHVCWHAYGLLYRAEKNYEESIKAYKFALRLEPDSAPIQRDLAHLQIQMRDYEGYIQSRRNMLQQKPGFRQNWTALAIAQHLAGNYEDAETTLSTYEETLKAKPNRSDMEHWEAILYKNYIIAESGEVEKALDHLEAVGKKAPDVLAVMEMRADYLARLGRKSEAEAAYAELLHRNPDDSAYYDGWIFNKGLKDGPALEIKKAYDELAEKFPRADLPRRRPLDVLSGDDFRQAADQYLQRMLRKGVPSTFANIKQLYTVASKRDIVQDLVEGYASRLSSHPQTNGTNSNGDNKDDSSHFDSSVLYFLAQHYNYKLSRDLDKALDYSDKCISLDPKSVDFHAVKARTYKHKGDFSKAAELMEQARSLDEKDRAINTKCAKYQLRNDQNDKALETASKFTQNRTGGPLGDLVDMQCVWYLVEDGQSYLRQRRIGLALKRFHQVFNVFETWQEDQFDFHTFSLRKGMIRAYVDMLRWEDRLREHPFFSTMATSAVKAYLLLFDNPDLVHGPIMDGANGTSKAGEMTVADRKKVLKKAKREQEKLEKAEAEKKAALKASKPIPKAEEGGNKKEDPDPFGKTLLETKEPLKEAMKFLGPLLEFCPENSEAQELGFETYLRRKKYLLAVKSLLKLKALGVEPTKTQELGARLKRAMDGDKEVPDKVREIVKAEAGELVQ